MSQYHQCIIIVMFLDFFMLKMPAGDSLPITDVIIIADLKKVPNGYDPVSDNLIKNIAVTN